MRKVLIFEVIPVQPSGGLLLQLAVSLRQLNINPESLVWTATPLDGSLKLRLVLREEDQRWLRDIADHLKRSCGVGDVHCVIAHEPLPPADGPLPDEVRPFMG